jgi:hypothetical protein
MAEEQGSRGPAAGKPSPDEIRAVYPKVRSVLRRGGVDTADLDDWTNEVVVEAYNKTCSPTTFAGLATRVAALRAKDAVRRAVRTRRLGSADGTNADDLAAPSDVRAARVGAHEVARAEMDQALSRPGARLAYEVCKDLWFPRENRVKGATFLVGIVVRQLPHLADRIDRRSVESEILRYWDRKAAACDPEKLLPELDYENVVEMQHQKTAALVQTAFRLAGVDTKAANAATNTFRVREKRARDAWAKRVQETFGSSTGTTAKKK